MSTISSSEVARGAGVETQFVDRLIDLEILTSREGGEFSPLDVRRARIVQTLTKAGLPLEGLAEALRVSALSLDFIDNPTYERWAALGTETFEDLSRRTEVPVGLLITIRETMGFGGVAQPGDPVRLDELAVIPLIQFQFENG